MLSQEDRQEIAGLMKVIVESDITPKLNLILDGLQTLMETKVSKDEAERRNEQVDTEIAVLKAAYRQLSREVAELKQAN